MEFSQHWMPNKTKPAKQRETLEAMEKEVNRQIARQNFDLAAKNEKNAVEQAKRTNRILQKKIANRSKGIRKAFRLITAGPMVWEKTAKIRRKRKNKRL